LGEQVVPVASCRQTNFQCFQTLEQEGHNERRIAIGRKNYLFAGSDAGGRSAAALYSLIESAKLNGLNPQHYLADVLARIADHPARRIAELLPWKWQPIDATRAAA
jgi:transposase